MHSKIVLIDEAMSMIIRELKLPRSMKLGKRIKLILRKNFLLRKEILILFKSVGTFTKKV
jgi:hypothetical protein